MKKSKLWFILWIVSISLGSAASAAYEIFYFFENGVALHTPPYTDFQKFQLLVFLPLCLIPILGISCRYAIIEKNKKIKIASICLIIHHLVCVIAVLFQVL